MPAFTSSECGVYYNIKLVNGLLSRTRCVNHALTHCKLSKILQRKVVVVNFEFFSVMIIVIFGKTLCKHNISDY